MIFKKRASFLSAMLLTVSTATFAQSEQSITHKSDLTFNQAPEAHFSGKANFAGLPSIPDSPQRIGQVNFEAGTVTDWHVHSHGQYLIVTEGEGRTQEWGKPVQIIKKGDVVWCPPGVKHWHGAGEHTAMSHITINPNAKESKVEWLERVELPKAEALDVQKYKQTTPLSAKQLSIVPIAAFSATGDLVQLKPAIVAGLESGLTVNELKEIFAHQYAYAGFPRALNGLQTLQAVLAEREKQGIKDEQGREATKLEDPNYYQLGNESLVILGSRQAGKTEPLFGYDGIDYALKAHLFGYLFQRDNLSFVDRELVTVSTLAALGNVNGQLGSHLNNTQNLGVSKAELSRVIDVLENQVDRNMASNARNVLNGKK